MYLLFKGFSDCIGNFVIYFILNNLTNDFFFFLYLFNNKISVRKLYIRLRL